MRRLLRVVLKGFDGERGECVLTKMAKLFGGFESGVELCDGSKRKQGSSCESKDPGQVQLWMSHHGPLPLTSGTFDSFEKSPRTHTSLECVCLRDTNKMSAQTGLLSLYTLTQHI